MAQSSAPGELSNRKERFLYSTTFCFSVISTYVVSLWSPHCANDSPPQAHVESPDPSQESHTFLKSLPSVKDSNLSKYILDFD